MIVVKPINLQSPVVETRHLLLLEDVLLEVAARVFFPVRVAMGAPWCVATKVCEVDFVDLGDGFTAGTPDDRTGFPIMAAVLWVYFASISIPVRCQCLMFGVNEQL